MNKQDEEQMFEHVKAFNKTLRYLIAFYENSNAGTKNEAAVVEACKIARLAMKGDEFAAIHAITPLLVHYGDQIGDDNWQPLLANDFTAERKDAALAAGGKYDKLASETMILVKTMYAGASGSDQEKIRNCVRDMLAEGAACLLIEQGGDEDGS